MRRAIRAVTALLVAALVVTTLVVLTLSSASQLPLAGGPRPFVTSVGRCDDSVDATSPSSSGTSSSVLLSGVDAACAGGSVGVTVYDPSTWAASSGVATVPAGGGSVSVPVSPAYSPSTSSGVSVTIGTWPIPATWTFAVPSATGCVVINPAGNVVSSKACALTFGANTDASGASWNVKVTVTTAESKSVMWRATIDFADATRFPFRARYVGEYTGGMVVGPVGSGFCARADRVVTVTGNAGYGWDTVSSGVSRTLDLVGSNAGPAGNPVYACP